MIGFLRTRPAILSGLSAKARDDIRFDRRAELARWTNRPAPQDQSHAPAEFAEIRMELLRDRMANLTEQRRRIIGLASQTMEKVLGIQPYHVQQLAAFVMASGQVAEMATGEGKSLAVALAATAMAASAQAVHIATANDYLAARDYQLFRPFYNQFGLSVGLCQTQQTDVQRRSAYASDIVYGTADHFAFDHLRAVLYRQAGMRSPLGDRLRRGSAAVSEKGPASGQRHDAIIVDEIDHTLIDEAETPLVLSIPDGGARAVPASVYALAQAAAQTLETNRDWKLNQQCGRVTLTDRGRTAVLRQHPDVSLARPWFEYVQRAIEATVVLQRDIDYVVRNQQVELIDPATGRINTGRQWQDGLYQAVEQKESLQPTAEYAAAAQMTRWRFFRLYRSVTGCSGTAWDCRAELRSLYALETVKIPLRCPSSLQIDPPHFAATREEKLAAILAEVRRIHATGRPLLIGTRTIQDSNQIAERLRRAGYAFHLLNGSQCANEAAVIAQAGRRDAMTVATDLAGRGTDIKLTDEAAALGGLHVILAEPRHSQRLDRQLIGRAARQGQPGSARAFVSAEDELITQHAPSLARVLAKKTSNARGHGVLWRAVVRAAKRSESHRAVVRRMVAQRDRRHDHFFSVVDLFNR